MLFYSDLLAEQGRGGSRNAVDVDEEDRASRRPAPAAAAFRSSAAQQPEGSASSADVLLVGLGTGASFLRNHVRALGGDENCGGGVTLAGTISLAGGSSGAATTTTIHSSSATADGANNAAFAFALADAAVPDASAASWARALFEGALTAARPPRRVLVLCDGRHASGGHALRGLSMLASPGGPPSCCGAAALRAPHLLQGAAAAVLTRCHVAGIPAAVAVLGRAPGGVSAGAHLLRYERALPFLLSEAGAGGQDERRARVLDFFRARGVDLKLGTAAAGEVPRRAVDATAMYS